jgi:hypothetical protein
MRITPSEVANIKRAYTVLPRNEYSSYRFYVCKLGCPAGWQVQKHLDSRAISKPNSPAPQKYSSVTFNDFVDGPAKVIGAPTVEQLNIEECRRLLELRLAEGL